MMEAAGRRGYELRSRAKQFEPGFLRSRSLIVAMDRENYREILRTTSDCPTNVRMFSDFLGDDWPRDVPDPYYGGVEGFEYVLDMLEAGCPKILDFLIQHSSNS